MTINVQFNSDGYCVTQFACLLSLGQDSSASENSCITSEKIKPGDVIMMSSGLSQRGHGDHKFITVKPAVKGGAIEFEGCRCLQGREGFKNEHNIALWEM